MINRVVLKVGGSLLTDPTLSRRLGDMMQTEFVDCQINLLVGGGKVIDSLRQLDQIHHFDAAMMHWLCIRTLRTTCDLTRDWFPQATAITTNDEFNHHRSRAAAGWFIIAIDAFYSQRDGDSLVQDWTTTSDSIAVLLAHRLDARRVILLKSCPIDGDLTIDQAAAKGIVDQALPTIAKGLNVELRDFSRPA